MHSHQRFLVGGVLVHEGFVEGGGGGFIINRWRLCEPRRATLPICQESACGRHAIVGIMITCVYIQIYKREFVIAWRNIVLCACVFVVRFSHSCACVVNDQLMFTSVASVAMGKRPAAASRGGPHVTDADLSHMSAARVTKSGVHHILSYLHTRGFLEDAVPRNRISRAVAHHSSIETPYGTVVQPFHVGIEQPVECCHPAALLYYMCTISATFADLCKRTVMLAGDTPLRYIAYNDGVVPGNPFRPEKGRKVEAWYWVVVEWPTYIINRSGMWPVFTFIRSRLVDTIPGGVPHVTKFMLRRFRQLDDGIMLHI